MSFNKLHDLFESRILKDSLWNIPTNTRIETINLFSEVEQADLDLGEKEQCLRQQLRRILKNQAVNHIEEQQMVSLENLLAHDRFNDAATTAILHDVKALEVPVTA